MFTLIEFAYSLLHILYDLHALFYFNSQLVDQTFDMGQNLELCVVYLYICCSGTKLKIYCG